MQYHLRVCRPDKNQCSKKVKFLRNSPFFRPCGSSNTRSAVQKAPSFELPLSNQKSITGQSMVLAHSGQQTAVARSRWSMRRRRPRNVHRNMCRSSVADGSRCASLRFCPPPCIEVATLLLSNQHSVDPHSPSPARFCVCTTYITTLALRSLLPWQALRGAQLARAHASTPNGREEICCR